MQPLGSGMLRLRPGSFAGLFVMIALAVTIAAAAGQIMATALGAPGPGRFAAADAVVRADPTVRFGHGDNVDKVDVLRSALLSGAMLERIRTVPGVRDAIGDVAFPLTLIGRGGSLEPTRGGAPAHGHGWQSAALTPYRLAAGHPPSGPQDIVLDENMARAGGFRVGDRVRVVTPAGTGTFRLVGVATAARAELERQSAAFLTQARAQVLSGLPLGFNAIAVTLDPSANGAVVRRRIATAAGATAQVLDRRHAAAADAGDTRAYNRIQLVAIVASGGGITLAITIFVLAGTVAFAAERRRREIALLRAIGATPGQVRRRLIAQMAALGLLAGAAGCLAARALFAPFAHVLISVGLAPSGFRITPLWIPYAIAVGVGVVVAVLATVLAARRALAARPGEALLASALPPRRMSVIRSLLGIVALGGGLTLVIVLASSALSFATLAAFVFMIAVALLGPVVLGWPAAVAGRAVLPAGGVGFLAGTALGAGRFRVAAVGAAVALVVALTGTQVLSIATAQRATERVSAARVRADYVLVPRAGGGLPGSVAATAAKLPGASATGVVSTQVFLLDRGLTAGGSAWNAAGLDTASVRDTLSLDVRSGSLADVRGSGIAVSDTVARGGGVKVGRLLHARLADATPALLRVVAIYRRANGLGDIVLPRELALAHATAALDSAVFVGGRGADVVRGLSAIARAVPTAVLRTRAAYLSEVKAAGQQNARAQWVIAALMIVVAVMGALNAGAMGAAERRGELVLARLCGATRGQVVRALTLESLLNTFAGLAMGIAVTLVCLAGAGSDPNGGPLAVPWGQAAVVVGGATALGLVGTLLPAALVGRARLTALAGVRE